MLSQNQIKHIVSLKSKKFREESHQFIAEGHKLVMDLLDSPYKIAAVYALSGWILENLGFIQKKQIPVFEIFPREMKRMSALSTPSPVLAVIEIPTPFPSAGSPTPFPSPTGEGGKSSEGLQLALDDIRDPGNLGTIIRIADWFGIDKIFCSETCVDLYNPKVVQATMGSIARINVQYVILEKLLEKIFDRIPVYGTFLDGENLFEQDLSGGGIILIGNESRGISPSLARFVSKRVVIPSSGKSGSGKAESLNASAATAIICAEFRRQGREAAKHEN